MTIDKAKLTPLIVFLGGMGYTLFPFLDPPTMNVRKAELPEKLNESWFNPKLAAPVSRDPFMAIVRSEIPPVADSTKGAATASGSKGSTPSAKSTTTTASSSEPEGLRLGALVMGGNRPAAIINGKVYIAGDEITPAGESEFRWQLVRIRDDGVDLVDFRRKRSSVLALQQPSANSSTKSGTATQTASTRVNRTGKSSSTTEMDQLKEVLGPASDSLTPLPPGVTEALGRILGADLKQGNLGALESFLGSSTGSSAPVTGKNSGGGN